jgi:hypothetical protein
MATRKIVKFKVRRGQDRQRKTVIFNQGEPVYTTDTKRVFIGDGLLSGGVVVGNLAHSPLTTNNSRILLSNAVTGDIVNENGYLYQLSGSNYAELSAWGFIGSTADDSTIAYNAQRKLIIKDNGITGVKFAPSAAYSLGGLVATAANGLSANVDQDTLTITATNQLSVLNIKPSNIHSTVIGSGLVGGSGSPISVNIAPEFAFNGINELTLSTVTSGALSASVGLGLYLSGGKLTTNIRTANATNFTTTLGEIDLADVITPGATTQFENITYDTKGRVTATASSIYATVSSDQGTANHLSAFNGWANQSLYTNQTILTTLSAAGTNVITLSSAGFMFLETKIGNIAIPIFKY